MKRCALVLALVSSTLPLAGEEMVTLEPIADASIFEEFTTNASGKDPVLYVGMTQFGDARRALLKFDLSSIPADAQVKSASLTFHIDRSRGANDLHGLHRATMQWSEGPAVSPDPGAGGMGVSAASGDVTWSHAIFSGQTWSATGGDFETLPSATAAFGAEGTTALLTGAGLVADVQAFIEDSAMNHGWVLLGNEAGNFNARRLTSREAATPSLRPALAITYTISPQQDPTDTWAIY